MISYILDRDVPPDDVLAALRERFSMQSGARTHEILTYLDTFDWRLFRKGITLTSRARRRQAYLSLAGGKSGPLSLLAPRVPSFSHELPPGPLQEALKPVGPRRLLSQVRVRARSRAWTVLNEDEKTIVRLVLREGRSLGTGFPGSREEGGIQPGKEGVALPPFLHLIPLKGYETELRQVAAFLKQALSLRPTKVGELGLALEALGRVPADYSSSFSLSLDPAARADEATRSILQELFHTLVANEEGTLQDLDSEFLHDLRVAVRRTRSALGQIKGVLPPDPVRHFRGEFRWLGGRTGPTRDMDVYLLKIPLYREALPGEASQALEPLVHFLEARKTREHRALARTLRSRRYLRLKSAWADFLEGEGGVEAEGPKAARPIRWVASERILKVFHKVLSMGGAITPTSPAEELHRLRIECKKLRYLLTFFQSLYPPEALGPPTEELKRLQDNLGDYNDLQVQIRALRSFAEEMMARKLAPPETFLAMGRLVGQLETRQLLERRAFSRRFRAFSRRKNRRHFEDLFGSGPTGP